MKSLRTAVIIWMATVAAAEAGAVEASGGGPGGEASTDTLFAVDLIASTAFPNRLHETLISFQGIVNRDRPRLFVIKWEEDYFWLSQLEKRYGIDHTTLADPWEAFDRPELKALCHQLVVYEKDDCELAQNAALTAAGVEGCAILEANAEDLAAFGERGFTIHTDLRGLWSSSEAAQAWAFANYHSRCHPALLAIERGHFKDNNKGMDYMVQKAMFVLCLDSSGQYISDGQTTQRDCLASYPPTVVFGFWSKEVKDIEFLSEFGHTQAGDGPNISVYNHLPHLVVPVITDPKKVVLGLRWAISEMESRYKLFAKVKVRNIESYNSRQTARQVELFASETVERTPVDDELPARVPYIVIVIDELADLMLAAGADIENGVARLAQLSRAVGIHMIIATQRPSVNVITGTIKANFPARIAFQVAQKVDSRTILDQQGADKLLGRGDMLYLPPSSSKLARAQGSMVTDEEMHRVVEFINAQAEPAYEVEIKNTLEKADMNGGAGPMDDGGEDDELLTQSVQIIRETHRASTSSLQRRLRIGYTRAARVMDILEERGIVGPARGAEPREILIDLDVDMPDSPGGQDEMDMNDEESPT